MLIKRLAISELLPATYNPRKDLRPGDPEYEKLKKSILEFDYIDPIIWNQRSGRIVGGHQRLKVLQELGHTEVDVSVVDLPDEKEKALNLALNKTGGDWELSTLKDLLEELNTGAFDIEITGFSEDEIEELMTQAPPAEVTEDNFDAAAEADKIDEPVSKLGDVWALGRHRLMCGDSTSSADVLRLMDGELADMVFTDPPYNVDYGEKDAAMAEQAGTTRARRDILNDHMGDSEFHSFLLAAYQCMYDAMKPGAPIYVCHADTEGINFRSAFREAGFKLAQCLVWAKNTLVLGRQDYQWRHEPILYGWKPGAGHKWYGGRDKTTVIEDNAGVVLQQTKDGVVINVVQGLNVLTLKVPSYEIVYQGNDEGTTVWRVEKPAKNADHPTMKPINLPVRAIINSTRAGETVLDLFGGSGSTLIAAEQTNRRCCTMELDPKYCDVIVKRWEQFTGQTAEVIAHA